MTPDPTNEERQAAQEIIFAHPIWNSPNFTTLAIDLRVELTRREKQVAEARELLTKAKERLIVMERNPSFRTVDEIDAYLEATK